MDRGPAKRIAMTQIHVRKGNPDNPFLAAKQYRSGDKVPASGIYRVTHDPQHGTEHEVMCVAGKKFPRCHGCTYTRFKAVQAMPRVESHEHFKVPKSAIRHGKRHGGLFIIIVCLFIVGLVGLSLIRFAPELANIPWIFSLDGLTQVRALVDPDKEHERLAHFFEEVGFAYVVAAIVGAGFEISMRKREERQHQRHIEEIERGALSSLLGYLMPTSISDEVRRVFQEKIMRSDLRVKYTFASAPPELLALDSELLLVTVRVEYDLLNLTKNATYYTVDHGFEPIIALDSDYNKFIRLKITQGHDIKLYWATGLDMKEVRVESPERCMRSIKVENSVKIGAGTERHTETDVVHVLVEHQVVRRFRDQDTWTTWLPADCLDVKVDYTAVADLDFHLERTHPVEFLPTFPSATERKWALPTYEGKDGEEDAVSIGVLPFQGFTLYWFPVQDAATENADT